MIPITSRKNKKEGKVRVNQSFRVSITYPYKEYIKYLRVIITPFSREIGNKLYLLLNDANIISWHLAIYVTRTQYVLDDVKNHDLFC